MIRVTQVLSYTFFRVYRWSESRWYASYGYEYSALMAVTILVSFNVSTAIFLFSSYLDIGTSLIADNLGPILVLVYVFVLTVGYLVLVRSGLYLEQYKKYSRLTRVEQRNSFFVVLLYAVISTDRTPAKLATRDVGFPVILTAGRSRYEAQALHRREDHFDPERA